MISEWDSVNLEEIVSVLGDGLHGTPQYDESGEFFFVNGSNLNNGKIVLNSSTKRVNLNEYEKYRKPLNERTILVSINGTIGNVALFSGEPIILGKSACYFNVLENVDKYYVFYVLSSPFFQNYISNLATGSTIKNVSLKLMRNFSFPLPPRSDQEKIAVVLKSLDDRITLLRETNKTLESIAQAIFKSWFIDFDPVRAKMEGRQPEGMDEDTAALFPDSFEESELGLVPRGWKRQTMADVSVIGIGKTPPRKEQHWFTENSQDIPWLSIRDMAGSNVYTSRTSEFLTQEAVDNFRVRVVPENTVVMSFKMTVGRLAITSGAMTTNEAIAHFKLHADSQMSSEYIYLALKSFDFTTLSSTSSIADAVNSKTVQKIPILVPSQSIFREFGGRIKTIFERIQNIQQLAESLEAMRDNLLPRLISGKLKLSAHEDNLNA